MKQKTALDLRAYLRAADPFPDADFDDFLKDVDLIFRLRLAAEISFKLEPHKALRKNQALPLDWCEIDAVINPDFDAPPETTVTKIVRSCLNETEEIIKNPGKVLSREREKVSVTMVQQVDSHCLRWLSRQPGHNHIEKAGIKQKILAIVRKENFNTLENRIFKDFLCRIRHETTIYLANNEHRFKDHLLIKTMKRMARLCRKGLSNPLMETIGPIRELPVPNYVLRQERRYSKIWKAYYELVRQAHIAELLWEKRKQLADTLCQLRKELKVHTNEYAKYHCPIWFNKPDGKSDLLDLPFFDNEIQYKTVAESPHEKFKADEDIVLDLTGKQPRWNLMIYGRHKNAKPYLQNFNKPSIEDFTGQDHYFLNDLINHPDSQNQDIRARLQDYFEQLYAKIGGKRWFILAPDTWDALWQETIIKAAPLPRHKVFLLWRSVAAVIGIVDKLRCPAINDTIAVIDIQQDGIVDISKLTLVQDERRGKLVPQRRSFQRHHEDYGKIYLPDRGPVSKDKKLLQGVTKQFYMDSASFQRLPGFVSTVNHVLLVNNIGAYISSPLSCPLKDSSIITKGAEDFILLHDMGFTAYYDELEALSLIIQNAEEQIIPRYLVHHNPKSPGGKEVTSEMISNAATIKRDSDFVDLVLCMGEPTSNAPLRIKRHYFNQNLAKDHVIHLSAKVTPGQGMARVNVLSDFLKSPIELDFLRNMTDKYKNDAPLTISTLENEMERSFPPDSPDVLSDQNLWNSISCTVVQYMNGNSEPQSDWFARARNIYPPHIALPESSSPLERLRRQNVFGNDPQQRYPRIQRTLFETSESFFTSLFEKLEQDYYESSYQRAIIRLIAWTYASDHEGFYKIRQKTLEKIRSYAYGEITNAPFYEELTLCANLCNKVHEWRICLDAIEKRICNYNNKVSRDFYLLYNLLQFHPIIIKDTGFHENNRCWRIVQHIPHWYNEYRESRDTIGYILKSILYFLRCRRFDGKRFLTQQHDESHYNIISECLAGSLHNSHEQLRTLVVKYLNNRGTIDGLPVD